MTLATAAPFGTQKNSTREFSVFKKKSEIAAQVGCSSSHLPPPSPPCSPPPSYQKMKKEDLDDDKPEPEPKVKPEPKEASDFSSKAAKFTSSLLGKKKSAAAAAASQNGSTASASSSAPASVVPTASVNSSRGPASPINTALPTSSPSPLPSPITAPVARSGSVAPINLKDDNSLKSRASSSTTSLALKDDRATAPGGVAPGAPGAAGAAKPKPAGPSELTKRFIAYDNGTHEHCLKAAKRHEKIGNMIKDLLGAKKLRDEAVSALPQLLQGGNVPSAPGQPPSLMHGFLKQINDPNSPNPQVAHAHPPPPASGHNPYVCNQPATLGGSFLEKYGRCQEVIGKGAFGVVRISHKAADRKKGQQEQLYAVKEFKRRPSETEKHYNKRLTSEFCISSSLHHPNIIHTLDLLQDAKGDYCEVMEFCSGGDLYTLILSAGKLEYQEADCFFKQIIRGVNYMHDMGVAHRDLKPENILLTLKGTVKITDFGNGECFRMAWEKEVHLSNGLCGSAPYIAPEEYHEKEFDPRPVDIWACGVIYMAMRTGRHLWRVANADEDEFYTRYLQGRKDEDGYEPIEHLKRARCRNVIYSILDPVPSRRITGKQILNSEWGREIKVCDAGEQGA